MSRKCELVYSPDALGTTQTGQFEILASSEDGIPMGWILCFGGRNFWKPDDKVIDRGGTAAARDRFTTPVEVADARLSNAIACLDSSVHMWLWFSGLRFLHRELTLKKDKGYIRLRAPWAIKDVSDLEKLKQCSAHAENYINQFVSDRIYLLPDSARLLETYCPFVPVCQPVDYKQFKKLKHYKKRDDAERAAFLMIGEPVSGAKRFKTAYEIQIKPVFDRIDNLPPFPDATPPKQPAKAKPAPKKTATPAAAPAAAGGAGAPPPAQDKAVGESTRSFLQRLKGLVTKD